MLSFSQIIMKRNKKYNNIKPIEVNPNNKVYIIISYDLFNDDDNNHTIWCRWNIHFFHRFSRRKHRVDDTWLHELHSERCMYKKIWKVYLNRQTYDSVTFYKRNTNLFMSTHWMSTQYTTNKYTFIYTANSAFMHQTILIEIWKEIDRKEKETKNIRDFAKRNRKATTTTRKVNLRKRKLLKYFLHIILSTKVIAEDL